MSRNKNAFTLIELLVVISIISLLMGILVPVLASARRAAHKVACKSNLRSCAFAFRMYLDDNNNKMPSAMYLPSIPSPDEENQNLQPICKIMAKYLPEPAAFKCPADRNPKYFNSEGSSYEYNIALNGIEFDKRKITIKRHGHNITLPLAEIFVMRDYDSFHGKEGKVGSVMYLYADNLIGDNKRE